MYIKNKKNIKIRLVCSVYFWIILDFFYVEIFDDYSKEKYLDI
jgi:hypothetical protein